jgi:hypothetical protein
MVRLICLGSFIYFDLREETVYACVLNLAFIVAASKFFEQKPVEIAEILPLNGASPPKPHRRTNARPNPTTILRLTGDTRRNTTFAAPMAISILALMRRSLFALLVFFTFCAAGQPARNDTTAYVRLIFIANCFTAAENSAFKYAAANLTADYERDTLSRQVVKRIYFDNARQIVDSINHQRLVIKSVDFLSHSRDDRIGATMTRAGVQYRTSLFESRERLAEARVLVDAAGGDLRNSSRMASIEEINFSHFSYDAVIEIHGCHAGVEVDSLPANICRRLSQALYMSGRQLAVVIGHGTRANPNLHTATGGHSGAAAISHSGASAALHTGAAAPTTKPGIASQAVSGADFRESVLAQDYRHGLRMVYFNGRTILATRVAGGITQAAIIAAIVQTQNGAGRVKVR